MAQKKQQAPVVFKNRKAEFEYFLSTKFTAGMVLVGTEIKAIRTGKVNLTDSYCLFIGEEFWVRGLHISEYKAGSYNNHEPKRDRKLLLTKRELRKIRSKLNEKGTTVIPTLLYIAESGYAKLEIAIARGKKMYDKRETLKEKEARRSLSQREEGR